MKYLSTHLRIGFVLALAVAWCAMLIGFRTAWTGSWDYAFLVWNLGLAGISLVLSTLIVCQQATLPRVVLAPLWLVFLPNAPYMITDFIHLRGLQSGPLWLDVLLLSSCAGTGLIMGYFSISQIHSLFIRSGRNVLGWGAVFSVLLLSGFGIYLGRFLRWRSVDIVRDPSGLVMDIADRILNPITHYRTWGVTFGFGVFLCLGYLIFIAAGWTQQSLALKDKEHPIS